MKHSYRRQLPSHTYPKLPHWHTSAQSGSRSHPFHICSTARARFPEEHSQPASLSTRTELSSHKLHFHSSHGTGTEPRGTDDLRSVSCSIPRTSTRCSQLWVGTWNTMHKPPRQHTGISSACPFPTATQGFDYTGVQPPPGLGLLGAQHSSAIESKPSSLTRD